MVDAPSTGTKGRSRLGLALVTGASAGLGEAFARAYAARGYDVALVARRADRLQRLARVLAEAHGVDAYPIAADLSIPDAHEPVLSALRGEGRHVDVLVNNAGFGIPQSFAGVPWAKQREFLMTMVVAPCGFARAVIPGMVERGGGAIVNVASLAAFSPGVAGNSLYPGSKNLLIKLSQSLDAEYRAKGIRVTAVCPGFTRTEFSEVAGIKDIMERNGRAFSQSAEEVVKTTIRANEAGRVVVVPGWHNKVAAVLMKTLPEPLVRTIIAAGSAKYHLEDE